VIFFFFSFSYSLVRWFFPSFIYLFILKGYSAREGWLGGLLHNFIFKPLIKDLFNLPKADWKAAQIGYQGKGSVYMLCFAHHSGAFLCMLVLVLPRKQGRNSRTNGSSFHLVPVFRQSIVDESL
jgi:hypothetical protein